MTCHAHLPGDPAVWQLLSDPEYYYASARLGFEDSKQSSRGCPVHHPHSPSLPAFTLSTRHPGQTVAAYCWMQMLGRIDEPVTCQNDQLPHMHQTQPLSDRRMSLQRHTGRQSQVSALAGRELFQPASMECCSTSKSASNKGPPSAAP